MCKVAYSKLALKNIRQLPDIEAPGGEQMVILPRKEYEQLCEAVKNADDVRVYDEAKR